MDDSKPAAISFLGSLLSKTLRITTSDTRLFVGEFKCTDAERNIILSRTYEYRLPSCPPPSPPASILHHQDPPSAIAPSLAPPQHTSPTSAPAPATISNVNPAQVVPDDTPTATSSQPTSVVLDMTSRYLGLVVVPGEFITKIEVEEFASQVGEGGSKYAAAAALGIAADGDGVGGVVEG